MAVITVAGSQWFAGYEATTLFTLKEALIMMLAMPAFTCTAAWLPGFWGAQQDPAVVLRNE